jgi:hypothetical protein
MVYLSNYRLYAFCGCPILFLLSVSIPIGICVSSYYAEFYTDLEIYKQNIIFGDIHIRKIVGYLFGDYPNKIELIVSFEGSGFLKSENRYVNISKYCRTNDDVCAYKIVYEEPYQKYCPICEKCYGDFNQVLYERQCGFQGGGSCIKTKTRDCVKDVLINEQKVIKGFTNYYNPCTEIQFGNEVLSIPKYPIKTWIVVVWIINIPISIIVIFLWTCGSAFGGLCDNLRRTDASGKVYSCFDNTPYKCCCHHRETTIVSITRERRIIPSRPIQLSIGVPVPTQLESVSMPMSMSISVRESPDILPLEIQRLPQHYQVFYREILQSKIRYRKFTQEENQECIISMEPISGVYCQCPHCHVNVEFKNMFIWITNNGKCPHCQVLLSALEDLKDKLYVR